MFNAICSYAVKGYLLTDATFKASHQLSFGKIEDKYVSDLSLNLELSDVSPKVTILQNTHAVFFQSRGNVLFSGRNAHVSFDPKIEEIDPNAARFMCRYHLIHLRKHDGLVYAAYFAINAVAAAILFNSAVSLLATVVCCSLVAKHILMPYLDGRAMTLSFNRSLQEECKGGLRYYAAFQAALDDLPTMKQYKLFIMTDRSRDTFEIGALSKLKTIASYTMSEIEITQAIEDGKGGLLHQYISERFKSIVS